MVVTCTMKELVHGSDASIFTPKGRTKGHCNYCGGTDSFDTYGVVTSQLTVDLYQRMLDRGWRRFGKYCWHPESTMCCPQYPIRIDAHNFTMSKDKEKVWKKMERAVRLGIEETEDGAVRAPKVAPSATSTPYDDLVRYHQKAVAQIRCLVKYPLKGVKPRRLHKSSPCLRSNLLAAVSDILEVIPEKVMMEDPVTAPNAERALSIVMHVLAATLPKNVDVEVLDGNVLVLKMMCTEGEEENTKHSRRGRGQKQGRRSRSHSRKPPGVPRCPKGHEMEHCVHQTPDDYTQIICDVCLKSGLQEEEKGYYHCKRCKLDIHADCNWEKVPHCPDGHLMVYMYEQIPSGAKYEESKDVRCSVCCGDHLQKAPEGYYHCTLCRLDLHRTCRWEHVPSCHSCGTRMKYLEKVTPSHYRRSPRCDVCQGNDLHEDRRGYYHCQRCSLDVHRDEKCNFTSFVEHITASIPAGTVWRYEGLADLEVQVVAPTDCAETYNLFRLYQEEVHNESDNILSVLKVGDDRPAEEASTEERGRRAFREFLVESPLYSTEGTGFGTFHIQYRLQGVLFMVTVVDILPRCMNSIYCFYDPRYRWFTPGKLSVLFEIEWMKRQRHLLGEGFQYYYLGMYIHSSQKMRYKSEYHPCELKCHFSHLWRNFDDVREKLDSEPTRYVMLDSDDESAAASDLQFARAVKEPQVVIERSGLNRRGAAPLATQEAKAVCDLFKEVMGPTISNIVLKVA